MNNKCGCQYTRQQCQLQLKWSSLYNYLPFDEWYNIFNSRKLMQLAALCARFVMMLRCGESSTITCLTTHYSGYSDYYGTSVDCNLQFFCLFFLFARLHYYVVLLALVKLPLLMSLLSMLDTMWLKWMQGEEIFNTAKLMQLIPQTRWEKFVPHSNYTV